MNAGSSSPSEKKVHPSHEQCEATFLRLGDGKVKWKIGSTLDGIDKGGYAFLEANRASMNLFECACHLFYTLVCYRMSGQGI